MKQTIREWLFALFVATVIVAAAVAIASEYEKHQTIEARKRKTIEDRIRAAELETAFQAGAAYALCRINNECAEVTTYEDFKEKVIGEQAEKQ